MSRAALLAVLLLAGCVFIPYAPSTVVTVTPALAGEVVLGAGPRRLLADYGDEVAHRDARLQVVEAMTARELLFGAGDWTMAALLDPKRPDCDIDYVAVIAAPSALDRCWGMFTFYLGFFGFDSHRLHQSVTVVVVDVHRAQTLACLQVRSCGRRVRFGLVYGFWFEPLIDRGLRIAVAEAVLARVREACPEGAVRFAFLAAEAN